MQEAEARLPCWLKTTKVEPGSERKLSNMCYITFLKSSLVLATCLCVSPGLGASALDVESESNVEYSNAVKFQEQGKYSDAVKSYKRAAKLNPARSETYYSLGTCFQAMHDSDAALLNFRKAASIKAKTEYTVGIKNILRAKAAPFVERGIAEMTLKTSDKSGDQILLEKAIKNFRKALELCDEPTTHFNLAQALKRAGLDEEAEREYHKSAPREEN